MPSNKLDRTRIARLWQSILAITERRELLFGELTSRLLDRHPEDRIPHPGFVGSHYVPGGLLFLGMNPGAGGNGLDPDELLHYHLLKQLQNATPQTLVQAFQNLIEYDTRWYPSIRIMQVIVQPVLAGAGLTYDSIAYINVLKWRTAGSSGLMPLYKISLAAHTLAQLAELNPATIAVLGVGVAKCLAKLPEFQDRYGKRCITIPRQRGDYRLPPEGHAAVVKIVSHLRSKFYPSRNTT